MKRIALITDGWKNFFLYAWPDGVLLRMNEYDVDFTLYQYSCHGNWSTEKLHNQGEYNIYNMPNLKDFDGIIFECNNIEDDEVINHVLNLIRESGVPAVSVGKAFDGLYYVGGEEKKPIETMIKHMYEKLGARSFVYAGGRKEHFGNQCRVNAYLSSLKQYGLNSDDNPVIYGEFDFINGMTIFENYINSGRKLPDVFICACDNIAAGLCTQAERMGYAVPRDFKVTGFDNLDKAAYFEPQITTAEHNRGHITKKAAEVLINIWEGNQVGSHNYVDAECIFAESCGCDNNGRVNYRRYIRDQIIYNSTKEKEEARVSAFEDAMTTYSEYRDMYEHMGEFMNSYDCDGFFIVVDKALENFDSYTLTTTKGYNKDSLDVVYASDGGSRLTFESAYNLDSYLEANANRNHYIFTPIHFKEYAVGYTVIKNGRFLYDNANFFPLHNILVKSLESLYMKKKLENAHEKLKDIYNKDQLTGIHNRIAFSEIIAPAFKEYSNQGIVCAIGFIDIDDFKQFNDTYGHDYGDEILKKVAEILQNNCPDNGYVCRYGGDEFIIFFPHADSKSIATIKAAINRDAEDYNMKLSIGIVLSSEEHGNDINAYFEVADKHMYEEKQQHKSINN